MGAVYAAFDPRLDRRVALKVLHDELATRDQATVARLLREARAMAKLTHPNIVTVHDAGIEDGRPFVAMELVSGSTLGAWREAASRSQRELLDACVAAGHGLAAAHAEGLVHRDFKPDNVMIGDDGRVLVTDFGLARAPGVVDSSEASASGRLPVTDVLTRTGAVVGTPAYMSPEQFAGDPTDARSDQFSFCVTVWELLYGERPFAGKSLQELSAAVISGRRRPEPTDTRVPPRIRRALDRGLSTLPDERYPAMDALLAELASPVDHGHRRGWFALAGLASLGIALGVARSRDACDVPSGVSATWNGEREASIREAFVATQLPYATTAWQAGQPKIDAFFEQWSESHRAICRATHEDGTSRRVEWTPGWTASMMPSSPSRP